MTWEAWLGRQAQRPVTPEPATSLSGQWLERQTRPRKTPQQTRALKAAIEKSAAAYVLLTCGHYTTAETIERYSVWQKKRGTYYCENCQEWIRKKPKPRRKPLPDIPSF